MNKQNIATTVTLPVIKSMAKKLQKELGDKKFGYCLEIMARLFDFESFNHLTAALNISSSNKEVFDIKIQEFMNAFWDEIDSDYINGFAIDKDDRKECSHTFMLFGKKSDTWFEDEAEMNQEAFEILAEFFKQKDINKQYMLSHFDEMIVYIKEWATNQNIISFMKEYFDSKHPSFYRNSAWITWFSYHEGADIFDDVEFPYSYMINGKGCETAYRDEESCLIDAFSDLIQAYEAIIDIPEITFGDTQYDLECLLKRILRCPL